MKRIMLTVAYDGTDYNGWQWQPRGTTIEGVLNKALTHLMREEIHVQGASRTDAGVHALGNLCIFDTESRIPPEKICYALNQGLPGDIVVSASREVPAGFHPRKWNTEKTYEYSIDVSRFPSPLRSRYAYTTYYPLNVRAMREAGSCLVGEHDFAAFCSAGSQVQTTVRRLLSLEVLKLPAPGLAPCRLPLGMEAGEDVVTSGQILLRVRGNGFLYNMVRIIAGTLMEAGRGHLTQEAVREALNRRERAEAGPTAPPEGLCLKKIRLIDPPWEDS